MRTKKIVGICPAAGRATRLGRIPCSKELIPIGFHTGSSGKYEKTRYSPKAISQYMIESMILAGSSNIFLIVGNGKSDIIEYYTDGSRLDINIAYLYQEQLLGMPFALDIPFNFIHRDTITLFGMPDTFVEPNEVFVELLSAHIEHDDDVTLGLFKTHNPQKFGMVELDGRNVVSVVDKPRQTSLTYLWGVAVWNYKFSSFLHQYVQGKMRSEILSEVVLSDVFVQAINKGLKIRGQPFDNGLYLDIGTADDLFSTIRHISDKQLDLFDVDIDR